MTTTVVQTRLAASIAKQIDERANAANMTRAEIVRTLLEAAIAEPQLSPSAPAADPLLGQIADEIGALLAKVDACLTTSRDAARQATAAHGAARLGALMLLPVDRQQMFVEKLTKAVQP